MSAFGAVGGIIATPAKNRARRGRKTREGRRSQMVTKIYFSPSCDGVTASREGLAAAVPAGRDIVSLRGRPGDIVSLETDKYAAVCIKMRE